MTITGVVNFDTFTKKERQGVRLVPAVRVQFVGVASAVLILAVCLVYDGSVRE